MAARLNTLDAKTISAPVSGWRRLLGDWAVVGSAEVVCQALGTVTSLLLRMLLDPAQMGVWQGVKLFLSYGNYANLGVSKGAARELSIAMGGGDTAKAERGLNLAFTANTLSSLAYAAILLSAGLWIALADGGTWSGAWAAGLAVGGLLAVLGRYVSFQVTILRAKQAFGITSQVAMLEAVVTLGVGGLATWRWGLPGLYAGTLAVTLGSAAYLAARGGLRFRWAWNRAEMQRLIGIGGPILAAGVVFTLFRSLDRLMILGYMSDREFQLGCYSLALMVSTQLYGIGNMLSIVMGPRYGEKFGHSRDRREVAMLAARASELQAAAMALAAGVALVLAGPVLGRILPDYETGLAPLVWLLPGVVPLSLALPASQYLVAVDRQGLALVAVALATGITAGANHFALTAGCGLAGLAAATAAGYTAYFLLVVGLSIWRELTWAERRRYAALLALAIGPTVGLAAGLEMRSPGLAGDWRTTLARLAAVILVWMTTVRIGWRHAGWREALRRV